MCPYDCAYIESFELFQKLQLCLKGIGEKKRK